MDFVASDSLPVETFDFKPVSIELLKQALEENLKQFWVDVAVEIVQCPDLSQAPYNLAVDGIGADHTAILDIGGPPYLIPLVNRSKVYDLATIVPKHVGSEYYPDGWYVSGAAAGPWPSQGANCEMVVNLKIENDGSTSRNHSKVALTSNGTEKDVVVKDLPDDSRVALLANVMVSAGKGKVLKIKCRNRSDKNTNFVTSIRNALSQNFDFPIGLGGLFMVRESPVKTHIMRDFTTTPLNSEDEVNDWLKFFNMDPPMLFQSVLVSTDPGLDLRVEHSHGWGYNEDNPTAGHYHHDVISETADYQGYFAVAQKLYRIDRPDTTHSMGR